MYKIILSALVSSAFLFQTQAAQSEKPAAAAEVKVEEKKEEGKSHAHRRLFHKKAPAELLELCKKALDEVKDLGKDNPNQMRIQYHLDVAKLNMDYISKAEHDREAQMFARRCMREVNDARRVSKHSFKESAHHAEPKKEAASAETPVKENEAKKASK